jgi:hypothetical protein
LGILYLSNAYTSDGQHKEPQQQQSWGEHWGEQTECQPATTTSTYSWASAGYASTNASEYATDHIQHVSYSTSSATTAARDRLEDFQCTKPPTFSHALAPMDVDDWLKSVEKKL